MSKVVIGVDPHKLSVTIEVVDDRENNLGSGRFTTDKAGFTAMRKYVQRWSERAARPDADFLGVRGEGLESNNDIQGCLLVHQPFGHPNAAEAHLLNRRTKGRDRTNGVEPAVDDIESWLTKDICSVRHVATNERNCPAAGTTRRALGGKD